MFFEHFRDSETVAAKIKAQYEDAGPWPHLLLFGVCNCSTKKVEIPLTISCPSTIFTKVYVDIMNMDAGMGYKHIVAACDDLSRAAEGHALQNAKAKLLPSSFGKRSYVVME